MKKLLEKWNGISLPLRILTGLIIGIILGLVFPKAGAIALLGTIFVGLLKAVAPILVFVLVTSSLAGGVKKLGGKFYSVIILYMVSTFLAAFAAVVASFLFPVTIELADAGTETVSSPGGMADVFENLLANLTENPVSALVNANYIGILFWAVIFGLALKKIASNSFKDALSQLSDAVSDVVRFIISLAPLGIMGLVFTTVSQNGMNIFVSYGKLLLLLVGCMLFIALVIDPLIAGICLRKNPYPLVFRCFKESGLTAFFTRSSAANIPVNMALCERLGLDKDLYSVSIPLGATINMDGAAITITVMTLAAVHTLGMPVSLPTALLLSVMAALGACGSSGVAGGSLMLIPMACSLFGISNDIAVQVVAVGFIIGVVQDSFETAINSSGDVLFAAVAEFMEWRKNGKEIRF